VLIIILTIVISSPIIASAEDGLRITNWLVESKLLENGDISIVEDITFKFNEKYNGVFREIVLEGTSGIEEIRVLENSKNKVLEYNEAEKAKKGDSNVFLINDEKNTTVLQIFSPSKDEEKTFRIIYTVKNVAKKYNDTGEFYYKFLGSENETPIDFFSVVITLPQKDIENKVKVFAHGPLNGQINKISDDSIHLSVENVPKSTFIEGRVLFPKEFIVASNNIVNKDAYLDIMNEEARLQEKIKEDIIKRKARGDLFGNISALLAIIEVLIFALLTIKYRRNKDIFAETKYLEVPEDNTPAVVSFITSTHISNTTIIATILDIYRKGYVKIDNGNEFKKGKETLKEFIITKIKEDENNLLSHEVHFLSMLIDTIGNGTTVTTKKIQEYGKKNSSMFTKHYAKWIQLIKEDANEKGYFDDSPNKYGLPLVILFPLGFILSVVTLVHENFLGLFLMVSSVLILIQGIMLLSRKSDYGYEQYKKWMEFKKYIKALKKDDFILDKYKYSKDMSLIYGLTLGLDNDILNNFNLETSHREDTFSYGYGWMYWFFILNSDKNNAFNKSINNSFNSVAPQVDGGGGGAGGGGAGGF